MELSGPAGGAIPIEDKATTPRSLAREIAFALAAGRKAPEEETE